MTIKTFFITRIPRHAKLAGNGMADKLENIGRTLNIAENIKAEKSYILAMIKNETKIKFENDQRNKYNKDKCYTNILESFHFKP